MRASCRRPRDGPGGSDLIRSRHAGSGHELEEVAGELPESLGAAVSAISYRRKMSASATREHRRKKAACAVAFTIAALIFVVMTIAGFSQ
jgi:hypothetical protein